MAWCPKWNNHARLGVASLVGLSAITLVSQYAYAEGGCPAGSYPIGGGNGGWQGCAPIPGYQDESSPGRPPERPKSFHEQAAAAYSAQTNSDIANVFIAMRVYEDKQRIEAELGRNPVYQRMKAGYWEHETPPAGMPRGDGCSATYVNLDGAITIAGPRGDYRQAAITFWGGGIPTSRRAAMRPVTLAQTGGNPPATVRAYHYTAAEGALGAVTFVVPSADALLGGIFDTHDFKVSMNKKPWLGITWKNGNVAKARLEACLRAR